MPDLPGGYLAFDDKANKFDWAPGGYDELTGTFYNLSDGLEVAILRAAIEQQVAGDVILLNLGFEVEVQTLPPKAGKDYPWKVGEKKVYYERYTYNPKTGEVRELESNTAGTSSARSVLALKGDTVVLVGKTVSVRQGRQRAGRQHLRPGPRGARRRDRVHRHAARDGDRGADEGPHRSSTSTRTPSRCSRARPAKIRMSIYRDKPKAKTK